MTTGTTKKTSTIDSGEPTTEVGSVFVSNYPPYSFWNAAAVPDALRVLDAPPAPDATLGLYLHIPFCRLRCKFCYFKVYTDKDSDQVRRYLDALAREVEIFSATPAVQGRPLTFVYFGGGTPSFIGSRQLKTLVDRLQAAIGWQGGGEISFECEPGTLTRAKLDTIRDIGVTRLSLGVENFDDGVLKENGRAHLSAEIDRTIPWVRDAGFEQFNIDLIAGMVGETWETWRETVRRTIDVDADTVTIYQMELPYNTVYSKDLMGGTMARPVAGWDLKRAWHDHAIEALSGAGYEIDSAYTMVKKGRGRPFVYRNAVWRGTDMIGAGVASFSHMNGVHFQNVGDWGLYLQGIEDGHLPLERAYVTTAAERQIREMILQLKLGRLDPTYFRRKFNVDIMTAFRPAFERLESRGMLTQKGQAITLTRQGLLQADSLLPEFYDEKYRNARYT